VKAVLQRVSRASVETEGAVVASIGIGLLVLIGFSRSDSPESADWMADRIRGLRIFSDDEGRMNRSVEEVRGGVLVVSQFTLYGDARKGRRPSFVQAAPPEIALPLYDHFVETLRRGSAPVRTGRFGASMRIEIVNDGPVTILLER